MAGVSREKREYCHEVNDEELKKLIHEKSYDKVYEFAKLGKAKKERSQGFGEIFDELVESLNFSEEELEEKLKLAKKYSFRIIVCV